MIKFFTILFLVYYTIKLFKPGMYTSTFNAFLRKAKVHGEITDENAKKDYSIKMLPEIFKTLVLIIFVVIPITIAEVIYIFSAVQYGDKLIAVGFIVWWMFLLLVGVIRGKIQKANGNIYKEIKKVSLWGIFVNLIDIAYFGYMYFVLFLK